MNTNFDKSQYIFAHIPRTGGKTLKYIIDKKCQNKLVFYHQSPNTKKKYNQNLENLEKQIITIIRNPVTRLISEWVSYGKAFTDVSNIEEYINDNNRKNIQCKFLLGYEIYDNIEINTDHFSTIKNLIQSGNLVVGIFEDWKMDPIYNLLDIPKTDQTLKPPVIDSQQLKNIWKKIRDGITIDDTLKQNIQKNNQFDVLLYKFVNNYND